MARYCFYCGRQLQENERCNCRDRQRSGSGYDPAFHQRPASESTANTRAQSQKQAQTTKKQTTGSWRDRFRRKTKSPRSGPSLLERLRQVAQRPTGRPNSRPRSAPRFHWRTILQWLLSMFTTPRQFSADLLRTKSTRKLVLTILAEGTAVGFMLYSLARSSNLALLLRFTLSVGNQAVSFLDLFISGFLFAVVFYLAKSGLLVLFSRTSARIRMSYRQALTLQIPGTIYAIFFILLSMLATLGSGFQAIALLIVSLVVRAIIDLITWSDSSRVNENQAIVLIAFVYLILLLGVAVVAEIILPGISRFSADGSESIIRVLRTLT